MENQTNYSPQPQGNSSGANTVLLIIIILIIVGAGYWWYTHRKATPVSNNPNVNVEVKLPDITPKPNSDTTSTTTP